MSFFHVGNGFVLKLDKRTELKKLVMEDVNKVVAESEGHHSLVREAFLGRHNNGDPAGLRAFCKKVTECLVPLKLRHLLYKSPTKIFGNKEFTKKLFEAVHRKFKFKFLVIR
jgi:hypothetical protein